MAPFGQSASRRSEMGFTMLRFRSLDGSHESIGIGDWFFPRHRRGDCTEISFQGRRSPIQTLVHSPFAIRKRDANMRKRV
jgi:hypothetical protein